MNASLQPTRTMAPGDNAQTASEHGHGVCWAAIFAGAAGAAVLSLVLLLLGTGIGFSAVSPWDDRGASAATVGVTSLIWVTIVQLLASVLGGYLAGRLRSKWASLHTDETYFRDTAHGFLAWAVATLVTASLLSSVIGTMAAGGAKVAGSVAGTAATMAGAGAAGAVSNAATGPMGGDALGYFTDSLFRPGNGQGGSPAPGLAGGNSSSPAAEAGLILGTSLKNGSLTDADAQYLAQLVAQRTGMAPDEARKRVNDTFAQAQKSIQEAKRQAQSAADTARKASAEVALWLVASLLIGAFAASWAATLGGRLRDKVEHRTASR